MHSTEEELHARKSAALPPAKCADEIGYDRRRQRLLGQPAEELDRQTHVVEVTATLGAVREMCLEARNLRGCEGSVEVLRDELDELPAGEVISRNGHPSAVVGQRQPLQL
jgi:hypothetical protein